MDTENFNSFLDDLTNTSFSESEGGKLSAIKERTTNVFKNLGTLAKTKPAQFKEQYAKQQVQPVIKPVTTPEKAVIIPAKPISAPVIPTPKISIAIHGDIPLIEKLCQKYKILSQEEKITLVNQIIVDILDKKYSDKNALKSLNIENLIKLIDAGKTQVAGDLFDYDDILDKNWIHSLFD